MIHTSAKSRTAPVPTCFASIPARPMGEHVSAMLEKNVFSFFFVLIFIMFSATAQDNRLSAPEKKQGWKLLFDGSTAAGWKSAGRNGFPEKGWKIENGAFRVLPKGGGGDIVTLEEYGDFELSVDFRLTEGTNSGVKYFVDYFKSSPAGNPSALGLEYQIIDDARHPDAKAGKDGNRALSSLYDLIPANAAKKVKPMAEWNTARIVSRGSHVEHWLNGAKVLEYERGSDAFKLLIAESKYKDIPGFGLNPKGRIMLQDHGDEIYFKNIKIKAAPLPAFGKTMQQAPGIVSYSFRNSFPKDFGATLDTIRQLGITNIEFSNLFGKTASAIRQLLDERGMRCTSFGTSYDDALHNTAKVVENAKALGASFVRVAWIPHDNKVPFPVDTAQKAADDFNAIGKTLKESGLTFCYHNHGYEFVPYRQGTLFDYIAAHTNPAYVSFEMDILWVVHPGKDPVALLQKYGSRFRLMHVKDLRKGITGNFSGSTAVENDVAVGTGQIDVQAVIKAAQKAGIQNYYIEDESNNVNVQVPQSMAFLKQL